ncbi:MAG: hypothetical protein M3552_15600 [Planctomycetota bacterium]|nr:hypothetical protein [Planctomycetota bacterium]
MVADTTETARSVPPATRETHRRWAVRCLLWVVAFLLAGSAMVYQRATGPTYPLKQTVTLDGESYKYEFLRSHETTAGAPVAIVLPPDAPDLDALLHWRRYPTKDAYESVPMRETRIRTTEKRDGEPVVSQSVHYEASLPPQPAGKLEYYVTADAPGGSRRLPAGDETVLLRYKDPVPDYVLVPHVTAMILVIIVGMRAGLSALFDPRTTRRYAWVALMLMTVGGMTLGPLVQKYAFGEYWTGFPWGGDWTDNKMLVMWLAWLVACLVLGASTKPVTSIGRAATLVAALVMTGVYLIPHSMGGSQLDYSAIEQGVDPQDAIRTGRQ